MNTLENLLKDIDRFLEWDHCNGDIRSTAQLLGFMSDQ
jgi:hypothetical protein